MNYLKLCLTLLCGILVFQIFIFSKVTSEVSEMHNSKKDEKPSVNPAIYFEIPVKDLDRAVIIGSRSFGKGLVQRPMELLYGTQVKVTISRYFTPSGRCIQALDYSHKDINGKAIRTEVANYNAFKTKKGRTVYDGGGIQPDLELSESKTSAIAEALIKNDGIFNFVTDYYYKNLTLGDKIPTISDSDFNNFKAYLKKTNFDFNTESENLLKKTLEATKKEKIDENITLEYQNLLTAIQKSEEKLLDKNQNEIKKLILEDIIKRFQYKEGLYQYYLKNNTEIKKATAVLQDQNQYKSILKL